MKLILSLAIFISSSLAFSQETNDLAKESYFNDNGTTLNQTTSPRIIFIWYQNEQRSFKWDLGWRQMYHRQAAIEDDIYKKDQEFSLNLYYAF